jgi:basic amino acid/polyamine antiporter, APA family
MPDQQQTLNHALSFGGASAISTGLAFAAINFLGIAQMLGYVRGPLAWAAVLCAGLVILAVRALFSELNGMYPTAAGIRLWMARAMNDRLALIITFTYMAAIILVIAADAFISGEAIAYAFSNGRTVAIIYVAALLGVATWLNLRGIRLVGAAEKIITTLVVTLTIAVGAAALVRHSSPAHPGTGVQGSPVSALILGIFLYTGFEWVTTNSEEVVKPTIIPKAMLVAIGALAASQALFAVAMGVILDHGQLGTAYPQPAGSAGRGRFIPATRLVHLCVALGSSLPGDVPSAPARQNDGHRERTGRLSLSPLPGSGLGRAWSALANRAPGGAVQNRRWAGWHAGSRI